MVTPEGGIWALRVDGPNYSQIHGTTLFRSSSGAAITPLTWDLFDADGRFRGSVDTPARFRPDLVTDEGVWGVALDDFDVQYVVFLELVGESGGQ